MVGKITNYNSIGLDGDTSLISGVTVMMKGADGYILLASGTTVPSNNTAGFAKGCLFIDTDVAKGTTGLYCNKGTTAECTFTAVTQA